MFIITLYYDTLNYDTHVCAVNTTINTKQSETLQSVHLKCMLKTDSFCIMIFLEISKTNPNIGI